MLCVGGQHPGLVLRRSYDDTVPGEGEWDCDCVWVVGCVCMVTVYVEYVCVIGVMYMVVEYISIYIYVYVFSSIYPYIYIVPHSLAGDTNKR